MKKLFLIVLAGLVLPITSASFGADVKQATSPKSQQNGAPISPKRLARAAAAAEHKEQLADQAQLKARLAKKTSDKAANQKRNRDRKAKKGF